jgi:hypothetical protein
VTPGANERASLLVCMFHLNLAFSSLASERRAEVVRRCYWPMLDLAERTPFPIGFEATGWTLEQIARADPAWIDAARRLIEAGRMELVASAYAQSAAPLMPADANRWNLRLGLETYEELLGVRPGLALVCEQAYSPGLVSLYAEAGFEAMIVDWDNAYRSHPQWARDIRRNPQRAVGADGRTLPVVWSESIAFQKFQRLAHREMDLDRYVEFVVDVVAEGPGALLLYANDAEVFDHRPGRFAAEPPPGTGEWDRIAEALEELVARGVGTPALPHEVLKLLDAPGAGRQLRLESPSQPVPVKKQNKYNISRWAVTGRDDIGINTRCRRLYEALTRGGNEEPQAWRTLCGLWASDFRTHITAERWGAMVEELETAETRYAVTRPPGGEEPARSHAIPDEVTRDGRLWRVRTGFLDVVLNARRGLAIESFADQRLGGDVLFGTLEHGYFPTIELGADWYTGDVVQETPLRQKITDLEPMEPCFGRDEHGVITASGSLQTELGAIEKTVRIDGRAGTVEIDTVLRWTELPPGSLRAAHLVLHPEAFDADTLYYATHNGGDELERHELAGTADFDLGEAVSHLVSCRQGLGLTGGVLLLGDAHRTVRMDVDLEVCTPLGLVGLTHVGDRFFFRAALSITEADDTRRGGIARTLDDPQRIRVVLAAHG